MGNCWPSTTPLTLFKERGKIRARHLLEPNGTREFTSLFFVFISLTGSDLLNYLVVWYQRKYIDSMFCGAVWLKIFIHRLCLWDKKSQQQRLTIIQIYVFYWIIFQNKTSPFNSCRSYCRNVHRSDGGRGERVDGGLVCVDTERESTLMSQITVAYACSRKNKVQLNKGAHVSLDDEQLFLQAASCLWRLQLLILSLWILLLPSLSASLSSLLHIAGQFRRVWCFPLWSKKLWRISTACFGSDWRESNMVLNPW